MKSKTIAIHRLYKASRKRIRVNELELQVPESVAEAVVVYGGEAGLLRLAHAGYVAALRKPKRPAAVFAQLNQEQQEQILRNAGVL